MDELCYYEDGGLWSQVRVLYVHPNMPDMLRVQDAFGLHYVQRDCLTLYPPAIGINGAALQEAEGATA